MIEINNENVMFVDVDETLVTQNLAFSQAIDFDNYGIIERLFPIDSHIDFIKKSKARGRYIIIWSSNGHAWCKEVVTKLGLTEYVDMIMTKPVIYVDDSPMNKWAFRVFLEKQE